MRGCQPHSPSPPTPPLEDGDLLAEILLRLPPQPSSLPRASAVCKRWRSLASDPAFTRRFRRHHRRNPPLLGCFMKIGQQLHFQPALDPPNRVPPARFSFPMGAGNGHFSLLGCRHGLLLMRHTSQDQKTTQFLVWDPVNGHQYRLPIPLGFGGESTPVHAAVLRSPALRDIRHFQLVLVSSDEQNARLTGRVYSSETGAWGNLISTLVPDLSRTIIDGSKPAVLVGDSIYMLLLGKSAGIVELDVDRQSLAVIPLPELHVDRQSLAVIPLPELDVDRQSLAATHLLTGSVSDFSRYYSVMRAHDGGGLGFLFVSFFDCSIQLWQRNKKNCDGAALWVLERTIELDKLLPLNSQNQGSLMLQGFAEENNVVFLSTCDGTFMLQLDSLQLKKLPEIRVPCWHPFEAVYATETGNSGGNGATGLLHNT